MGDLPLPPPKRWGLNQHPLRWKKGHAFITKIKEIVSVIRIQSLLAEKEGDSPIRGNVA